MILFIIFINMKKQKKAFTLVELVVVIVILSILATIGFMSFTSYAVWARDSKREQELAWLKKKIVVKNTDWKIQFSDLILKKEKDFSISNAWVTYSWVIWELDYLKIWESSEEMRDPVSLKPYKYLFVKWGEKGTKVDCFEVWWYSEEKEENIVYGTCKKHYTKLFWTGTWAWELFSNGYDLSSLIKTD